MLLLSIASLANRDVEIKANWSRTCKEEGLKGTQINVNTRRTPGIDVDPFAQQSSTKKNGFISIDEMETAGLREKYFNRSISNISTEN